jgi:hypothetical protein
VIIPIDKTPRAAVAVGGAAVGATVGAVVGAEVGALVGIAVAGSAGAVGAERLGGVGAPDVLAGWAQAASVSARRLVRARCMLYRAIDIRHSF